MSPPEQGGPPGDAAPGRRRPTRRALLVAGAATLGVAAVGQRLAAESSAAVGPRRGPAPSALAPSAPVTTTPSLPLADPVPFATIERLALGVVMQDFSYLPDTREFFVTQSTNGANGSALPYESVVISRVDSSGDTMASMTLVDGGHGLGIEAESQPDAPYIWLTWHGKSADSGWRENDFVRLRFTPGTWTRGQALQQLDLAVLPVRDEPEAVYHFDWKNDWAVERHYDFNGVTESYKRRRISDIRAGVNVPDDQLDLLVLAVNPPTTQGFATIDDTFYRWLGKYTTGGAMDPGDPITLQRWEWGTERLIAEQTFPNLSKAASGWPDGRFEPEGMSVFREVDGAATLLVGDATGSGAHQYHVSAFARIVDG